ncbi:MAG: nitrate reductase [Gammaproteobacteria bacterium]|nr:MAG: nitrate reductase [Gammaproteobacteria bacterium]
MSFSVIYALLFYFATGLLVIGLGRKIVQYAKTPAPLKIPTTPAPTTRSGVVLRMAKEVIFFYSLFRSNKWIWIFGWMFHMALFVVLARHLRYFTDPVWWWVELIQPFGKYAAFAMIAGLLGLWARRIVVDRVRYISAPSDHLMLALLLGIGISGASMTFVSHTDIVSVKAFFLGLMRFDIQPLPSDPLLLTHLGLVAVLMIVFPFSKLLHVPGVFFSPTRNQVDNPREQRHLAPWAAELEAGSQQNSNS